ncbi:MAG: PorP/SprF family type IX secretion system membrane protein [Bacteroidales bacterium]|nr:PorP/SprF family type IX secretion system membrane protein [Bacteroidales bacterium]
MKIRLILFSLLFLQAALQAQENHFSQFYNAPQYLNPAFSGDVAYMRTGAISRITNPLPGISIINSLASYDIKLFDKHTGLGIFIFDHTEKFSHTKIQANYSYTIQLNKKNWAKGGLGISMNQRRSRATALNYPDQFDNNGLTGNPTMEPMLSDNSWFPALTAGFLLYNELLWFGFSGDYLNLPKENFAGEKYRYPLKVSATAGFLVPIDKSKTTKRRFSRFGGLEPYSRVGPVVGYVQQDRYAELSGGCSYSLQPFYGGIHYRYQHNFMIQKTKHAYKALVFIVGFRREEFSLAYSYDLSVNNNTIHRKGAHEMSATIYFSHHKNDYKRHNPVPLVNQMLY